MSETKNVVIQQNNGINYDILYPDSNSWKKDQVAVLETFQKYGLDANAVPKDLFDYLISQIKSEYGKMYSWTRWKWVFTPQGTSANGSLSSSAPDTWNQVYIAQFKSVQVHRDGSYTGVYNKTLTLRNGDDIPPNYYYGYVERYQEAVDKTKPLFYCDQNSDGGSVGYIGVLSEMLAAKHVSLLSDNTNKQDITTVTSTNQSMYSETDLPDSEGYFYEYQRENFLPTLCQIYSSFYTGTGTYGRDNTNTITFTGKPQLIFIQLGNYNSQFLNPVGAWAMSGNDKQNLTVTWGNNQVSWYSSDGAAMQGNSNGNIYRFIVIQTI